MNYLPILNLNYLLKSFIDNIFLFIDEETKIILSTSNDIEFTGWSEALTDVVEAARDRPADIDTQLTPHLQDYGICNYNLLSVKFIVFYN